MSTVMSAPSATPSAALAPRQFAAIAAIMQAEARIHLCLLYTSDAADE